MFHNMVPIERIQGKKKRGRKVRSEKSTVTVDVNLGEEREEWSKDGGKE